MRHFGMFRVASSILKFFKNNFLEKGRQWKIKNNRDASMGSNFASPWLQPELRCVMTFFNGTTLPSFLFPPLKLVRLKPWITFKFHFHFFSEQNVHFLWGFLKVWGRRERGWLNKVNKQVWNSLQCCIFCHVLFWNDPRNKNFDFQEARSEALII